MKGKFVEKVIQKYFSMKHLISVTLLFFINCITKIDDTYLIDILRILQYSLFSFEQAHFKLD